MIVVFLFGLKRFLKKVDKSYDQDIYSFVTATSKHKYGFIWIVDLIDEILQVKFPIFVKNLLNKSMRKRVS